MMERWERRNLGEVCHIARGGSPRPIQQFLTDEPNGVNWVKISDATASGKFIYETKEKIKPSGVSRSRLVQPGDFLLSNSMSFGRPYIMQTTGCIHDGWLVLSDYEHCFDQSFLYYLLSSPVVFGQFDRLAAGSTVRNLNIELASRVSLPVPPLPEQQRIVGILEKAFDGIATAKANAEKSLRCARELFVSELKSVYDLMSKQYGQVALEQIADDITDGDHMPPPKSEVGVPFITISNIDKESRKIDFSDTFLVSQDYFQKLKSNRKPREGDVLYTVTGSFGIPVVVNYKKDFCFQRHIGLIRPGRDLHSDWLYYLLLTPQVMEQAISGATGTAQKTVSLKVLRNFLVPMAPLLQQERWAKRLTNLLTQTEHLASICRRKVSAINELKNSLLHQAFTGAL